MASNNTIAPHQEKSQPGAGVVSSESAQNTSGPSSENRSLAGVENEPADFKADKRFWLALLPILILAAMVSLDGTAVTVALPVSSLDHFTRATLTNYHSRH
jgi:hypothetical protein